MRNHDLLTLRLQAPLTYEGLENPPLGAQALLGPCPAEELFVFPEEGLVAFDPDEGPRVAPSLPPIAFHGRLALGAAGGWTLPRASYLFLQWRPRSEEELREGIEWFAREAWWEGQDLAGPYLLRRVPEDGKVAVQLLRSLAS